MSEAKKRAAVVGAGIAGLSCAYALERAGFEVVVYEKEPRVGGRMASRTLDGFVFDTGADHLCDLYDRMKEHCEAFGIPWEPMRFLKYGVFKDGRVVPAGEAVGKISKFRLAVEYLRAKGAGTFFHLDQLADHDTGNAYEHMRRRTGREVADYFVDAFTSTYQFHRASEISLGALFGIMRSIRNDKDRWNLHRTAGGMQALPDAFAARLDVRVGTAAREVFSGERGVIVRTDSGEDRFDVAVLAAPASVTRFLYLNPTDRQREVLEATRYSSTISVAFRVDRSRVPDTSIVWVPYVESQKISGYVNEAMKGDEVVWNGETLISTWLHEEFAQSVMDRPDAEIFAEVKKELLRVCPWAEFPDELREHDLQKWPNAMPKFAHGHLSLVRRFMKNGQGEQNVFLAGDYLNSPWTEGALRNGERVALQVMERVRRAP